MAIRKNGAVGFTDAALAGRPRTAGLLERPDAATPWRVLAAPVYALPASTSPDPGRPSRGRTLMVKCLPLAKWYILLNPQLDARSRVSLATWARSPGSRRSF
jgi:hypothetical protein